jgi:VWFA-related protein
MGTAVWGQGPGERPTAATQQQEDDFRFIEQLTVIMAPTTVLDNDGSYVTGLRPGQFRLYDNEKLQQIRVDETYAPISLVVAVQADSKVHAVLPKIKKMGNVLHSLVAGQQGEIAILGFDHRMQRLTDGFTSDPDEIDAALDRLRPGSRNNALTDAVVEATRLLRTRAKDRRRVLLLIAESRDNGSSMKAREALTNLEVANVMVYALNISRLYTEFTSKSEPPAPSPIPPGARHVPAGTPITPTAVAQITGQQGYGANFVPLLQEIFYAAKAVFVQNPIELYTQYTGGKETGFVSQRDLEQALASIGRELHNQYLITYSPSNRQEGGYHRIRVEVDRPSLEVRTRGGYWLASSN